MISEISSESNFSRCVFGSVYMLSSISNILYIYFSKGLIPGVWNGDPRLFEISHQKRLSKNVYHCLVTKTMVAMYIRTILY